MPMIIAIVLRINYSCVGVGSISRYSGDDPFDTLFEGRTPACKLMIQRHALRRPAFPGREGDGGAELIKSCAASKHRLLEGTVRWSPLNNFLYKSLMRALWTLQSVTNLM